MRDKRIWIVVGYIPAIGIGVIHCTKYYVNGQGAATTAEVSAGAEETAASSSAPTLGQLDTETGGADAGMATGRAASTTPVERRVMGDAGPRNAASGNITLGDAGPGSAGPGNAAYTATPAAGAAGIFSSDCAASAMVDAAEETVALDTVGSAGVIKGAAVLETASEGDTPISPLTGARAREYKASRIVDYREYLEDLDTQTLKTREEGMDSNVYSIKASAETKLKLWEGELNFIYSALMGMLPQEDGTKLASEQQEWLKNRDARTVESSSRNSGSMEGTGYAAALVSLTRDGAYELAGRYEEVGGVFCEDEDSSRTTLSQQAKV